MKTKKKFLGSLNIVFEEILFEEGHSFFIYLKSAFWIKKMEKLS